MENTEKQNKGIILRNLVPIMIFSLAGIIVIVILLIRTIS